MVRDPKYMKKIISIFLCCLLAVGLLVFPAGAEENDSAVLFSEPGVLERYTVLFGNTTIPAGETWIVPKHGALEVREGVTLTIYGNLEVQGTLRIEGTVLVAGSTGFTRRDGTSYADENYGSIGVKGDIVNKGTLKVRNGNITNYPEGIIDNQGTMTLQSNRENNTILYNMARDRGDKILFGTIKNTGKIIVQNEAGNGIYNAKHATIQNDGAILCTPDGNFSTAVKGTVLGNKVKPAER